jgi:acyl-CoA thioester hydrolase
LTTGTGEGPQRPSGFAVQVGARQYEADVNGHVTHRTYLDWADHARYEYLRSAGIEVGTFLRAGAGPVVLELTTRYLVEIGTGDLVTVTVEPSYGPSKTFTVHHRFIRAGSAGEGVVAAEMTVVMGLLDHATRRLVREPLHRLRLLAAQPDRLDATGNH